MFSLKYFIDTCSWCLPLDSADRKHFLFFFFFVFLPFLGLLLWHMEVPRPGVHSEL